MGRITRIERNLGGSRTIAILGGSFQNASDWRDVELDGDALDGIDVVAKVECRITSGESVTPVVWNVTDDEAAGTGVECTSEDPDYLGANQVQTISVTLAAGAKKYRLKGDQAPGITGSYFIGNLEIGS